MGVLNRFILLVVFVSSTSAYEDIWSRTSSDGLTTCNYTYKYRKGREFEAVEEVLSEAFECGDSTATCTKTLDYNKVFPTKYSEPEGIDPRAYENVKKRVDTLARSAGISFKKERARQGSFSCTINPGYRVEVVIKPRYQTLNGTLTETCRTECEDCVEITRSTLVTYEIPVKNKHNDEMAGSISCSTKPAANIDDMVRDCNTTKLTSGKMFDAVGDVLHRTHLNTALNGEKTLEHTNIDGHDVWAIGMCWNGLNKDTCRACMKYLMDNIWRECENAKGAQLWVTDCGIRYAFHSLTTDDYANSFQEQN